MLKNLPTTVKTYLLTGIVLMLAVTTITYSNHFQNVFHFDDSHSVENNVYIRNIKNIPLFFKDGTTSSVLPQNQSYRPVVTTSLAIDYWLGNGYNLFYFHLTIFILFLLQGILMFLLFNKVYQLTVLKNSSIYIAIIAATWYLLHPAIAETVNYVIARSDLLSTFFVLLGFVLYAYSPFCRRTFLYLLPVGIGALAKPSAVMFAPILLVYILLFQSDLSLLDIFKKQNFKQTRQAIIKSIPAFVFCALMYLWVDKLTPKTWQAGGASPVLYLITQPFVILHYFTTLFVPTGLSADSDWSLLPGIWDIRFFTGSAFILVMLVIAFYTSKKKILRPISFGILWFFLALIPTSSIIPLAEVLNDHRMFFPFVGLIMGVAWAIGLVVLKFAELLKQQGINKPIPLLMVPVLLLLSGYAYGTHLRNEVWHTEEGLWLNVSIKSPQNGRGLMNYGLTQMQKGNYAVATNCFERALVLLPNYYALNINMGVLKEATGDKVAAESYFLKAIQLGPGYQDSYFFYGRFLYNQSRYNEAAAQLLKAIAISPGYLNARLLLMNVYQAAQSWDQLKALAEDTLQIAPDNAEVLQYLQAARDKKVKPVIVAGQPKGPDPAKYLTLSLQYYQAGKYQECINAAAEAVKLKPDYAEAYNNMGTAYNQLKQYNKAIPFLQKAIALKPNFLLAKNNLAVAQAGIKGAKQPDAAPKLSAEQYINLSLGYFNQGEWQKCIDACYGALALKPDYDLAYNNICAAYNKLGLWNKAIAAGEKGLILNPNNQLLKNNLQESYKRANATRR